MTTLSDNNKIEFYKFLNGDISIFDLENFIDSSINLDQQLEKDLYFELLSFGFRDKYGSSRLSSLLKEKIIDEGAFQTWKLQQVLNALVNDSKNLHTHLDRLYHMYCGICQDNGERKYEFKFLANLGLNYLYWVNEGYMKVNYGDKWKQEYDRCFSSFQFYHDQLRPFALEILSALNKGEIIIMNDGTYKISEYLKSKLEIDKIYELKHPSKNTSSNH